MSYEDLIKDGGSAVNDILNFYGLGAAISAIEQALAGARGSGSRFNQGIQGRGDCELDDEQKARIDRLARHYPATDFSVIGLEAIA